MIYTPKLDSSASTTLRSLAGAVGSPMTATIKELVKFMPLLMDSAKVCAQCQDQSQCNNCHFYQQNQEGYQSSLFTELIEKANFQEIFINSRLTERTEPKKKRKLNLCKSCQKKVKQHKKRQGAKQQEDSKEWKPEDGSFLEE